MLMACGGGGTAGTNSEEQVRDLVIDLPDSTSDTAKFNALFSGTPPASADKYRGYVYVPLDVSVNGNQADIKVRVKTNDSKEENLGEMQWKAMSEGGTWKLVEAPLPQ
jgi:hypothetical protein